MDEYKSRMSLKNADIKLCLMKYFLLTIGYLIIIKFSHLDKYKISYYTLQLLLVFMIQIALL